MTPRIVSPVSRYLSVADVDTSIAFYRDVLGFEARRSPVVEVVSGPARIELTTAATAADSTGGERPRGAAIVLLEIDDVRGMRQAVIARGGRASELEKVNWIKMQVFQIQDPDGHTLWFAQSFQELDQPKDPSRQVMQMLPGLPLSDVAAGVEYYQRVLGFHVNYVQSDLGVMDRDDVTVLLIQRKPEHSGVSFCEAYVRDADALHAELVGRGADVQGEPVSHPWGLRDFHVLDLERNRITFAQPFE
jgi:catechol 2,3-dioxygenase-like lactoylglutathione lyase family enzyme